MPKGFVVPLTMAVLWLQGLVDLVARPPFSLNKMNILNKRFDKIFHPSYLQNNANKSFSKRLTNCSFGKYWLTKMSRTTRLWAMLEKYVVFLGPISNFLETLVFGDHYQCFYKSVSICAWFPPCVFHGWLCIDLYLTRFKNIKDPSNFYISYEYNPCKDFTESGGIGSGCENVAVGDIQIGHIQK